MKPRIDLTKDMSYSRLKIDGARRHSMGFGRWTVLSILRTRPWDVNDWSEAKQRFVNHNAYDSPLVFTGTSEQIHERRLIALIGTGKYCDCCGAEIKRPPWKNAKYISLCDECALHMGGGEGSSQKIGWEENYRDPWWRDI